jgi:putative SOS response-associated peptidase YedK
MAGLWERWQHGDGDPLVTFTILTVDAPAWMRAIHHRMPAVLPPQAWDAWLDPAGGSEAGEGALRTIEVNGFVAREVTTLVNRPANDEPACREPVPGGDEITRG